MPSEFEGRLLYHKGARYYSPNIRQETTLMLGEVPRPDTLESNPFKPGNQGSSRVRYLDFVNPRKWTAQFAWISFIPAVPSQSYSDAHSYLGRILYKLPTIVTYFDESGGANGFQIPEDCLWVRLEEDLYRAVIALSHHYRIQCVLPFLPNVIGYRDMFRHKGQLQTRLMQAREWLLVWFGALSYLVACIREPQLGNCKAEMDHQWCSVLRASGLSPTFIDGVCHSLVREAPSRLQRAGIILDVAQPPPGQPHPSWFINHGVPVWYRWSEIEEALSEMSDEGRKLCPPPTLFPSPPAQVAVPPKNPAPATSAASTRREPPPSPQIQPVPLDPGPTTPSPQEPEWVSFFETREVAHVKMLEKETPMQRQRRENRMREPPTSSAPVFEWYRTYSRGDQFTYERLPVAAKARCDTLLLYGQAQKRYDPFFNEWDCCDEWGQDDSDDEMSVWDEDALSAQPIPGGVVETLVSVERPSVPPPLSYADSDRPNEILMDSDTLLAEGFRRDVDEIFGRFYGFTHPSHEVADTASHECGEGQKDFFVRMLGLRPSATAAPGFIGYETSDHYQVAQSFLRSLCSRKEAPPGSWDLRDLCVKPVRLSPKIKHIRLVDMKVEESTIAGTQGCYVFGDVGGQTHWRLGVMSAAAALLVCRLPEDSTPYDLASILSGYGVPFRIFYPSHMIIPPPSTRTILRHEIPNRLLGYIFTKEDYDAYLHTRMLLLGQSHMQAALKRGGIVWRLAVGTLGTSRVTQPPSTWGSVSSVDLPEGRFVDDALTTTELDLLCGAYECVSDDGKQRSLKSWWPLTRYYEKLECGENYGRWTSRRENWYQGRLNSVEGRAALDSPPQPLTYTEWKSAQHGPRQVRVLHEFVEQSSRVLLEAHVIQRS